VLFNRFYQPDFDLQTLEVFPNLVLSNSDELLLRLHWVAVLYDRDQGDLAITGGVHTALDVLKAMMAGATVAMMTSALLLHGVGHALQVESDMRQWMEEHEYESVRQMMRWRRKRPGDRRSSPGRSVFGNLEGRDHPPLVGPPGSWYNRPATIPR
jgi:hypothetical protein